MFSAMGMIVYENQTVPCLADSTDRDGQNPSNGA